MNTRINDLERKINRMTNKENNDSKKEFIEKYERYTKIFEEIDRKMEEDNDIDKNINIQELFKMLMEFNDNIENYDDMTVEQLKKLKNIIEMIDYKLEKETSNIIKE
jgi:molecular chaperone GrpE (heat shock protein)